MLEASSESLEDDPGVKALNAKLAPLSGVPFVETIDTSDIRVYLSEFLPDDIFDADGDYSSSYDKCTADARSVIESSVSEIENGFINFRTH